MNSNTVTPEEIIEVLDLCYVYAGQHAASEQLRETIYALKIKLKGQLEAGRDEKDGTHIDL